MTTPDERFERFEVIWDAVATLRGAWDTVAKLVAQLQRVDAQAGQAVDRVRQLSLELDVALGDEIADASSHRAVRRATTVRESLRRTIAGTEAKLARWGFERGAERREVDPELAAWEFEGGPTFAVSGKDWNGAHGATREECVQAVAPGFGRVALDE